MSTADATPPNDLADASATQLLALYATGKASPLEATQAVLARIARCNPVLNAFCWLDEAAALDSARQSTARWQSGAATGALDGVPVSIKDLILTRGWPTLRGSRTVAPAQPWDEDAPVTARLREAGAVLLGKTCTPEFGCKGETNSPLTGLTRNPWKLDCTPGGSSGGAAAAVASGMGPLAVGTDGAGSVRIPAAFCGNFGLKPSFGRVPAYPLSPFGTVAHLGPHTLSVHDAALMLNVMKRPDARDWTSLPPDDSDVSVGLDGQMAMTPEAMLGWTPFSYPFNLTQQPACTIPCGLTGDGLPIGLQIVGPMFGDALVLRAARAYETLRPIQRAPLPA